MRRSPPRRRASRRVPPRRSRRNEWREGLDRFRSWCLSLPLKASPQFGKDKSAASWESIRCHPDLCVSRLNVPNGGTQPSACESVQRSLKEVLRRFQAADSDLLRRGRRQLRPGQRAPAMSAARAGSRRSGRGGMARAEEALRRRFSTAHCGETRPDLGPSRPRHSSECAEKPEVEVAVACACRCVVRSEPRRRNRMWSSCATSCGE